MRHLTTKPTTRRSSISKSALPLLITALILSGCGTPGGSQKNTTTPTTPEVQQHELPNGASRELPPSEYSSEFSHAEQLLFKFNWMAAETVLATIPPQAMSQTDKQYQGYLQARIAYARGNLAEAKALLQYFTSNTVHPALRHKMLAFEHYMYQLSGDYINSAQLGDQLLRQAITRKEQASLQRSIWRDLQRATNSALQSASDTAADNQWKGWLELARLGTSFQVAPRQRQYLQLWHDNYPDHPAANPFPGGMEFLPETGSEPVKVTLLLPLSGRLAPAAQAVRDGYLANYYAARATDPAPFEVEVLDVLDFNTVTDAYNAAVNNGAEFVVGPLSKQAVADLSSLPGRQVPVLALNRTDTPPPPGETALVQLALAPEDEARQIARLAFGDGTRNALILRPAGSWGNKMEQALRGEWRQLGGKVLSNASYSSREDHSSSMATALNIPASHRRARELRSMLATKVESTARRRQDIDVVFLLSKTGVEARSLKPLLAYHYASDLPVYATSNIYRGAPDKRDQDLNGIYLVETPWNLGLNPALRSAIATGGTSNSNYARLNALGADAFLLQKNFSILRSGQDMLIRGNTGLLTLTPELQIRRELQRATFDGGKLIAQ